MCALDVLLHWRRYLECIACHTAKICTRLRMYVSHWYVRKSLICTSMHPQQATCLTGVHLHDVHSILHKFSLFQLCDTELEEGEFNKARESILGPCFTARESILGPCFLLCVVRFMLKNVTSWTGSHPCNHRAELHHLRRLPCFIRNSRGVSACNHTESTQKDHVQTHQWKLPVESHAKCCCLHCALHDLHINRSARPTQYLFLRTQQPAFCGHTWFRVSRNHARGYATAMLQQSETLRDTKQVHYHLHRRPG